MKFILSEKYILTEAAFTLPTEITQTINSYLKLIKGYTTEDLSKVNTQLDQYKANAQKIIDTADITLKSLGQAAIDNTKNANLDSIKSMTQIQDEISDFIEKYKTGIENIKRIKKVTLGLSKLFNSWNITKTQLEKTIFYKKFKKIFNDTLTIDLINKLSPKIIPNNDIFDSNKNKTGAEVENNSKQILSNIKAITEELLPILNVASSELENILTDAKDYRYNETQDAIKDTTKEDWAGQLETAAKTENAERATKEIWDRYYKSEWAPKDKLVASLGPTLVQELLALSFDTNLNPFIYFLKQTLLNNKPQALNINPKNYIGLHNSFVNNYISEEDLKGTGFLGYGNIIFNADLYNKSATDIIAYLRFQKIIKDKYATNQAADYFKDSTLKELYGKNSKSFIYHLFNKNKSVLSAEDIKVTDKNLQTMRLKSLVDIEKELEKCFNYSSQADFDKATWTSSTGINIVHNLKTMDLVVNALKYLATVYPSTAIDNLLTQYQETSKNNSYNISYNKRFNKLFNNYAISSQNAEQVAKDIIEAADLTKI